MLLNEAREFYKGIFWIPDIDNISESDLYFPIPCDSYGNVTSNIELNAKSGTTYNHERTWNSLPSNITHNKPYNYYPRGRVEINNGKAIIYCSPYTACDELKDWCIDKFNLTKFKGIQKVRIISDGSEHYKCYLNYYF